MLTYVIGMSFSDVPFRAIFCSRKSRFWSATQGSWRTKLLSRSKLILDMRNASSNEHRKSGSNFVHGCRRYGTLFCFFSMSYVRVVSFSSLLCNVYACVTGQHRLCSTAWSSSKPRTASSTTSSSSRASTSSVRFFLESLLPQNGWCNLSFREILSRFYYAHVVPSSASRWLDLEGIWKGVFQV